MKKVKYYRPVKKTEKGEGVYTNYSWIGGENITVSQLLIQEGHRLSLHNKQSN